jgi:hypothetical protein
LKPVIEKQKRGDTNLSSFNREIENRLAPLFDTAVIHVKAAVDYVFKD